MSFSVTYTEPNTYCKFYGHDHVLHISKYSKIKPFNQTRCEIYVNQLDNFHNYSDKCTMYKKSKELVKERNKQLHTEFYLKNKMFLPELLSQLSVKWSTYPKLLKVFVNNAKWITFDGNEQHFLAEDNYYYYEMSWSGS